MCGFFFFFRIENGNSYRGGATWDAIIPKSVYRWSVYYNFPAEDPQSFFTQLFPCSVTSFFFFSSGISGETLFLSSTNCEQFLFSDVKGKLKVFKELAQHPFESNPI